MIGNQRLLLTASFCLSLVCCQIAFGSSHPTRVTRSAIEHLQDYGTYIIYVNNTVSEAELQHFAAVLEEQFIAEIVERFFIIHCLTAKLSNNALQWVTNHENVTSVAENEVISVGSGTTINSSSWISSSWHLNKIGLVTLFNNTNNTLTGKGIDVYILDSGIHYEHADFNGRALYPGCDPIDKLEHQNQAGRDCEGHGTHVAGLVAGSKTGVANGVTLFSVRILNCRLQATKASLLHGLMCVINHTKSRNGTRAVINLSISGTHSSLAVNRSLQLALDNDIIIVASAGNGGTKFRLISYDSCKVYPAGYPGVITVGATDLNNNALMGEYDDELYFTNMGKCLDVFAPGYDIISSDTCPFLPCDHDSSECITHKTYGNTCKSVRSGTSQSAPIVTGAVALLLEKCPGLKHTEIKNMLRHVLSTSKVQFCKPFRYLRRRPFMLDVIVTVINTHNRLLYIGNLSNMNHCSIFKGLPLL